MTQAFYLRTAPACRWAVADRVAHCSAAGAIRDLLSGERVQSGFVHMSVAMPAFDDTSFRVVADDRQLLIAITPATTMGDPDEQDSVEIFFDPLCDGLGYFQFIFDRKNTTPLRFSHLPYGDAASTAFPHVKLLGFEWVARSFRNVINQSVKEATLVARFDLASVFRNGKRCGFQVARSRVSTREVSSWNLTSGIGFCDASNFGRLHLYTEPTTVGIDEARLDGRTLTLTGTASPRAQSIKVELADPLNRRVTAEGKLRSGRWSLAVELPDGTAGRYRIYPTLDGSPVEPLYHGFDLSRPTSAPPSSPENSFILGMFYDIPDDLRSNAFTPDRFGAQLDMLHDWGIRRVSWIDYGSLGHNRSFWEWASNRRNALATQKACGEVLPLVAKLCREKGMECIGVFKPFDMGFTDLAFDKPASDRSREIEGRYAALLEPVAKNQHLTMRSNPAWASRCVGPVTRIRLSSEEAIPKLRKSDVEVLVSRDNKRWRMYGKEFTLRQGRVMAPHVRWTPAGIIEEPGRRQEHFLEMDGLKVNEPYLAVRFKREDMRLVQRQFLLARAFDAQGHPAPLTLADGGSVEHGFSFMKGWPGWANITESIIRRLERGPAPIGMAFVERPTLPQVLEPSSTETHKVWLGEVARILASGVDGIDIRILCHHVSCESWLRYAFAESARRLFREQHGREPDATESDYEQLRLIRGACFTEFLRKAHALTRAAGKKLVVHLECGIEVPASMHTRMQLHLDWRRWIDEGILDEITFKYWGTHNRFAQEQLLPAARRASIPVHICDMNFTLNVPWGIERAAGLCIEAEEAGFSGFGFYETHSYLRLNPLGRSEVIGHADHAIRHAAKTLAGM